MSSGSRATTGEWLRRYLDVDRPVAYALAMRCWQFPAGVVTAVLIAFCLTPEIQGYYYTVATLLALQAFVDLGLQWVILHCASHEWAALELDDQCRVRGDDSARERLAGLLLVCTRWFLGAAIVFAVVIGIGGGWLLRREPHAVDWLLPWCSVIVLSSGSLAISPRIALLEGCQQVAAVNRIRFWQAVSGSVAVWGAMLCGAGLWVVVVAALVQLGWELLLTGGLYGPFFASLSSVPPRLDWKREVWPLQWRIAVQSIIRGFAFYLFTPVMFAFHGATVAGRMGMTWNILSNIQLAAFAWIRTRAPRYGGLAARAEFAKLDREFFRALTVSLIALVLAAATFIVCLAGLNYAGIDVLAALSERFLDPPTVLIFAVGLVSIHIAQCLAVYLRAHKRDPLLAIFVLANTLIGLSVIWLGGRFGPTAAACGFACVATLVTLPGVTLTWFASRRRWHAPTSREAPS